MEVIVYAAISLDGFIAKPDGDSDWVNDDKSFMQAIAEAGCIAVGRKTFAQFLESSYPVENAHNIVISNNSQPFNQSWDNVDYASNVNESIEIAKSKGYKKLLAVGGAQIYTLFLNSGFANKLVVDVHPLLLGEGMKLFSDESDFAKLNIEKSQVIENDIVQIVYNIKN
jgi:dihydrofolate reductase